MKCDCPETPVFRHTLTVEKPGTTVDAAGHVDLTDDANWVTVGNVRASFKTKGGREWFVFKQTQAETTLVADMPATTISRAIIPKWRLRFGARKMEVVASYLIDETGQIWRVEVKEKV